MTRSNPFEFGEDPEFIIKVSDKGEDSFFRVVGPRNTIDACVSKIERTRISGRVHVDFLSGADADNEIARESPVVQTISAKRLLAFYSRAERTSQVRYVGQSTIPYAQRE